MAWLNTDDMRKRKLEFELFVVRRNDNGQFFKKVKSAFLKDWPKDDVRRQHWTEDVEEATFYTKKGIKQAFATAKESTGIWVPEKRRFVKQDVEIEIVTLKVGVEKGSSFEVIKPKAEHPTKPVETPLAEERTGENDERD